MLRSFLVITLRILWRNKVTSFVNIFSLSIGITSFVFIMLYVHHEMSYDRFNKNYNQIYRLEADDYARLPPVFGQRVSDQLPEVSNVAFLASTTKGNFTYMPDARPEAMKQIDAHYAFSDSTVFDVFTFPLLRGDPHTALTRPKTIVLSVTLAKKLFGTTDPMGLSVRFQHESYQVTGIMQDIHCSHIEIEALLSIPELYRGSAMGNTGANSWKWSATYLLVNSSKVHVNLLEKKINDILAPVNDGILIDTKFEHFHLRPLGDLYFNGNLQHLSYGLHGNFNTIITLITIGVFMLILALINYVNLTTARSTIRAKEFAVKELNGLSRSNLRLQLICESILITLISLAVALTIIQPFMPRFNQLASINIQFTDQLHPLFWLGLLGGGILLGILSGIYPAFYLTSFQPVQIMKGSGNRVLNKSSFRTGLMVFQFMMSTIMMVVIITNFRQLDYMLKADLGFQKKQVVIVNTPRDVPNPFARRETFRNLLLDHPGVENVSYSYGMPGGHIPDSPTFEINGKQESVKGILVDDHYTDVLGIKIIEGRNFSQDHPGDVLRSSDHGEGGILISEGMAREFGLDSPIGKKIHSLGSQRFTLEIVGVFKDIHFRSLREKVEPLFLLRFADPGDGANIRIKTENIPSVLKVIQEDWKKIWPQTPFHYEFLDEAFNWQYRNEEQMADVIRYFTVLALIIACMGLFALSSFLVSRRTKEIGIRKSLGASVMTIYGMLSWNFIKWILLAIIIACPIGWYIMNKWLETFAYHIKLTWDIFGLAAIIAITIALLTITWQSVMTARANPVEALRYE